MVIRGFGASELVFPLLIVLERGKVSVCGVSSSCEVGNSGRVGDGNISSAVISISEYDGVVTAVGITKPSEGKNISVESSGKRELESTNIMLDGTKDVSLVLSIRLSSSSCEVRSSDRVGDENISSAVISVSECDGVVTTVGITKLSEGKNISVEKSGRNVSESANIMLDGTKDVSLVLSIRLSIILESGLDTLRDIGGSDSRTEDKGVGNVERERLKNISSVVIRSFGASELVFPLLIVLERGKVSVCGVSSSCEVGNSGGVGDGNISSAVISVSECDGVVTAVGITKASEGKNISVESSGKRELESTNIMLDGTKDVSLVLSIRLSSSSCEVRSSDRVGDGNISSAVISVSECDGVVTTVGITKLSEGKNISVEKSGRNVSESANIMLDGTKDVSLVLSI